MGAVQERQQQAVRLALGHAVQVDAAIDRQPALGKLVAGRLVEARCGRARALRSRLPDAAPGDQRLRRQRMRLGRRRPGGLVRLVAEQWRLPFSGFAVRATWLQRIRSSSLSLPAARRSCRNSRQQRLGTSA